MEGVLKLLQKTPVWLQIGWFVWLAVAAILVAVTARFVRDPAIETLDSRLTRVQTEVAGQSQKLDDVLKVLLDFRPIRIGTLALPPPVPERHVDWRTAMLDITGKKNVNEIDGTAISKLFETVEEPTALVNLVRSRKVTVDQLTLTNPTGTSLKGGPGALYAAALTIRNNTTDQLQVSIPKGQVFENLEPHSGYQNLVAAEGSVLALNPRATASVSVPAFCFNRQYRAPKGQPGNISPLKVRFTFDDQQGLWRQTQEIVDAPKQP